MKKKTDSGVAKVYTFITPAFNHLGVEYKSSELEARIAAGDEEALALVPELIRLGQIVELPQPGKEETNE